MLSSCRLPAGRELLGGGSTARDAVDLGYRVMVLEDCCLGYDEGTHRSAVEHILPMLGTVATSSALGVERCVPRP